jgi:UDP-N-acetylmuramoyl-L-alanyl-D-glutamate--2,6-diaminopimelate ligase
VDIFRMIGHAVYAPRSVVMEVSSHALYLRRVEGIGYQVAVWTNLSRDHLDFHQSMEAYYEAKKRLFTHYLHEDGVAVVNIDDAYGRRLVRDLSGIRVITYGTSVAADIKITNVVCTTGHTQITVKTEKESFEVQAHMLGQFSAYNIAALFGVAAALEIDLHRVAALCGNGLYVPGRMERVGVDTPFTVLVDYAHSPDALDNVLATLAPITKGRLICVFGCGGDRDPGKRAPMAQAVARWCDEAVVTSDNPRTEHPRAIIEDILDGIPLDFPHLVIQDRKKAIYHAIEHARSGDCICIAGKGHEEYQEIGTQRIHFSDREVALDAIESCKTPVCQ